MQDVLNDFSAASKATVHELNQLDCAATAQELAAAADDVESAGQALLAKIAAYGPESAQATSARKSLSLAVERYNDGVDKARSTVAQRQASKKLASALAKNKKAHQQLSKAKDPEAVNEAIGEFSQSADSVALNLRALGCEESAHQLAALAPIVAASVRQAASPNADKATRERRDALLDRWNSTLVAAQQDANGIRAETEVGSALAALGHAKAAALEMGTGDDTGNSAKTFALASKELDSALRTNPALIGTADALKSAAEAVVAAAKVVADLEAKGQKQTPAYATANANLARAREQWMGVAAKAQEELAVSAHKNTRANATMAIESAKVPASVLAAAAHQNGDSAASAFEQSAQGTIQELQSLGLGESANQVQSVLPRVLDAMQAVANAARRGDVAAEQAATKDLEAAVAQWNAALGLANDAVATAAPTPAVLSGLCAFHSVFLCFVLSCLPPRHNHFPLKVACILTKHFVSRCPICSYRASQQSAIAVARQGWKHHVHCFRTCQGHSTRGRKHGRPRIQEQASAGTGDRRLTGHL